MYPIDPLSLVPEFCVIVTCHSIKVYKLLYYSVCSRAAGHDTTGRAFRASSVAAFMKCKKAIFTIFRRNLWRIVTQHGRSCPSIKHLSLLSVPQIPSGEATWEPSQWIPSVGTQVPGWSWVARSSSPTYRSLSLVCSAFPLLQHLLLRTCGFLVELFAGPKNTTVLVPALLALGEFTTILDLSDLCTCSTFASTPHL